MDTTRMQRDACRMDRRPRGRLSNIYPHQHPPMNYASKSLHHLLFAATAIVCVACSKQPSKYVGVWEGSVMGLAKITLVLNADGTGRGISQSGFGATRDEKLTWVVNGKTMEIVDHKGTKTVMEIVAEGDESLTLMTPDKMTVTYKKIGAAPAATTASTPAPVVAKADPVSVEKLQGVWDAGAGMMVVFQKGGTMAIYVPEDLDTPRAKFRWTSEAGEVRVWPEGENPKSAKTVTWISDTEVKLGSDRMARVADAIGDAKVKAVIEASLIKGMFSGARMISQRVSIVAAESGGTAAGVKLKDLGISASRWRVGPADAKSFADLPAAGTAAFDDTVIKPDTVFTLGYAGFDKTKDAVLARTVSQSKDLAAFLVSTGQPATPEAVQADAARVKEAAEAAARRAEEQRQAALAKAAAEKLAAEKQAMLYYVCALIQSRLTQLPGHAEGAVEAKVAQQAAQEIIADLKSHGMWDPLFKRPEDVPANAAEHVLTLLSTKTLRTVRGGKLNLNYYGDFLAKREGGYVGSLADYDWICVHAGQLAIAGRKFETVDFSAAAGREALVKTTQELRAEAFRAYSDQGSHALTLGVKALVAKQMAAANRQSIRPTKEELRTQVLGQIARNRLFAPYLPENLAATPLSGDMRYNAGFNPIAIMDEVLAAYQG